MNQKEKIHLALIQIDNVLELSKGLQYTGFLTSHLLPIRYEFQRQLVLLTKNPNPATVQTVSPEVNG